MLSNGERGVRVGDRGEFRPHFHRADDVDALDRLDVVRNAEVQLEIAGELEGMYPKLGRAGLHAEPGGPSTHYTQVLMRADVTTQGDGRGEDRELGHRERRGIAGLRQDGQ